MFRTHEWMVAFRYLKRKSNERFVNLVAALSFLGIAIGVMVLIVTMSVMNGFREELLSKVIGFNGHMLYQPVGGRMSDYDAVADQLRALPDVTQVAPILEGHALATFGSYQSPAVVRGIAPKEIRAQKLIADNITLGSLENFGAGDNDIIIGQRLADKYGLEVDSLITLITPKGRITPMGTMPRISSYQVVAIFEVGEYNYDSSYFFMPLAQAQKYFQYRGEVAALEISLSDPDLAAEYTPVIEQKISEMGLSGRIVDWRILNKGFFNALQVERNVMFIILSFIILIAVFNIISTMIMMVKDKTRDIAILRTIGVSSASILRIFLLVGSWIGMTGTLAGSALGIFLAKNIDGLVKMVENITGASLWDSEVRFLLEVPAIVETDEVITVCIVALSLSFVAALIPAWRAAKIDPVESLRYE